jgi:hypothetical protein
MKTLSQVKKNLSQVKKNLSQVKKKLSQVRLMNDKLEGIWKGMAVF